MAEIMRKIKNTTSIRPDYKHESTFYLFFNLYLPGSGPNNLYDCINVFLQTIIISVDRTLSKT